MKRTVFFSAGFFLMCAVVWMGGWAFAAEVGMPLYAQNIYDDQGRGYEQGAYPGYEGQYNQEQLELPPLPEGDGQYNEEQPEVLEPLPYQEGDRDYNQEPPPYPEGENQYPEEPPEGLVPPQNLDGGNQYNEEQPEQLPEAPPVYPEIERQYNDELPPLPPLPEGDGQDEQQPQPYQEDGDRQYPKLPEPLLPDPGLERAPLEQDEPGLQNEIDKQLNKGLPALEDTPQAGLPALDDPALALASGQCANSGGRVTILVNDDGVASGTSYVKSGKSVAFLHGGTVGQDVTITPDGFFNTKGFRITPGSKLYATARQTAKPIHGLVKVSAGKSNETAHDVVICP